jgi:hypothetical protein
LTPDGSFVDTFVVTRQTKVVDGVTCVVVQDTSTVDGQLEEKTFDYFAQDKDGNVWYFGEFATQYDNGHVDGHDGSWLAGIGGAEPGIVMQASPFVGETYAQENAPGVAQDMAQVVSLNESVSLPYGAFNNVLETNEFSPLEPGVVEGKFYAPGVGLILTLDPIVGGDTEQLVAIKVDGTSKDDSLFGYAGGDALNGKAGNDHLDGLAGSDTINGGGGKDVLDGGNDQAADLLYGGLGNDTIHVGAADQAFGGSSRDILQLFDNAGFGSIDGGSEPRHNLAKTGGDVLLFDGNLDLASPGLSDRISGIETLSMKDGQGNDSLSLNAQDVLDLGDGTFDPSNDSGDALGRGSAVRVDGDCGDQLTLTGGNWSQIEPSNAPDDYQVFNSQAPTGNAYVLVQEDVIVALA